MSVYFENPYWPFTIYPSDENFGLWHHCIRITSGLLVQNDWNWKTDSGLELLESEGGALPHGKQLFMEASSTLIVVRSGQ